MKAPLARPPAVAPFPSSSVSESSDHSVTGAQNEEAKVVKLAELLGKDDKTGDAVDLSSSKTLKGLFSKDVPEQGIVLVLPSLDIQISEKSGALPGVGETSRGEDISASAEAVPQRPNKTASVLTSAAKDAVDADHEVAKSMGEWSSWTKSTVAFAPAALVNNFSQSFSRLVGSRMKAWTLLLLRHSLSTGDESSRKRLLGILAASLKVEFTSTKFQTIPLPDAAKGHQKEADVILPLLFRATVSVTGHDEKRDDTVTFHAPGTICGMLEMFISVFAVGSNLTLSLFSSPSTL